MTEMPGCSEVTDLLPEIAAGVADGDARARALTHIVGCARCRRELNELTSVLDGFLMLAPEHDPAPGFETRVLEALEPAARRRPRERRVVAALVAAACLLAAALAGVTVWDHTRGDRELAAQYRQTLSVAHGRYLEASNVQTATDRTTGHAFLYAGRPSWVFMTIEHAPHSGSYQVQLVTTDHGVVDVGHCQISAGKGSWGWTVYVPVQEITRIQLVRSGVPTMSAAFG
jgi:hypothetical protein